MRTATMRTAPMRTAPASVPTPLVSRARWRPPCIRHRPSAITGARQGRAERARAPRRGARSRAGLPGLLPRRRHTAAPPAPSCGAPTGSSCPAPSCGAAGRRVARSGAGVVVADRCGGLMVTIDSPRGFPPPVSRPASAPKAAARVKAVTTQGAAGVASAVVSPPGPRAPAGTRLVARSNVADSC